MNDSLEQKEERLTDKAFSKSLFVSIFTILLCMTALCSATYAWFSISIASNNNMLVSASFDLADFSVTSEGGEQIEVTERDDVAGVYTCTLPTPGKYVVTLTLAEDSTAKGHCIVSMAEVRKNTDAIIGANTANREGYEVNSPFTFLIETTQNDTVVEFKPVWGVTAMPDILEGQTYPASLWENKAEKPAA